MIPFEKCPGCGGQVVEKQVEKLLRGGDHTAIVNLKAEVCTHCGERLFSKDTIVNFEKIRSKLANQDVSDFQPLGQSFQVAG